MKEGDGPNITGGIKRTKGVTCACCMGSRPSAGSDDPLKSNLAPRKANECCETKERGRIGEGR